MYQQTGDKPTHQTKTNHLDMKKTVTYNGQSIKVDFVKANHTRVIDKKNGLEIIEAHGTEDFIINGSTFTVQWTMKCKTVKSKQFHFEGFTCGDSEKKMAEFIISKYGI